MGSPQITLVPHSPSIFNFQKCTFPYNILPELENKYGKFFDRFLSIGLNSRSSRLLLRCCKSSIGDVANVLQGDLRVFELLPFPDVSKSESVGVGGSGSPNLSTTTTGSRDGGDSSGDKEKSGVPSLESSPGVVVVAPGKIGEMDVARHLLLNMRKMNSEELNSCRDVDEEEESSTVRFNDALWCTSKDIQMLKSGTIKMMRLTVISDSPLCDFPYQTANQQMMTVKMKEDSEAQKKAGFHSKKAQEEGQQQTETTKREVVLEDEGNVSKSERMSPKPPPPSTPSQASSSSLSSLEQPSWKLLREKIRQAFQSYDIHVKGNTLVDLRDCPLSSGRKRACPSVSFVFVEECLMRNSESDIGRVASKTEILISHVHHISYYKRQLSAFRFKAEKEQDDDEGKLYGLQNATNLLTSLIEMQDRVCTSRERENETVLHQQKHFSPMMDNFFSHGLLIAGPSGCGKSLAVRKNVKKLRANLLVFNSLRGSGSSGGGLVQASKSTSDFTSFGETWTEIFIKSVASARIYPTVLLIPRIDECLLIKQNKSRNLVQKLVNHVCSLFDSIPRNSLLTVVATTDKPYLIPDKLRRAGRLEREVYIGAPSEEERRNILKSLSKKLPSLGKLDLDSVAKRTPGYVGQDLIRVSHLAILKSYEENCTEVSDVHIKYALSRILPTVLQGSLGVVGIQRATSLDHIAGLHSVKLDLIKAIVWPLKYPHAFRTMGITPPKGILLHSPPGCAKTTLVRAVAASHQTNFLSVSAAELFSSGVGDSEKIVADLFHRARMASPCILFIDELEAIVGGRQMSQKREKTTNESILSMFLTEMDGIGTASPVVMDRTSKTEKYSMGPQVLVVAATNRIDMIDSALIRPGRFDRLIYVPPLDVTGRLELLQICSKSIPFSEDVDLHSIAVETEYYTGADLVNLCREAAMFALTDNMNSSTVSLANFTTAKSLLGPSLSPEIMERYKKTTVG